MHVKHLRTCVPEELNQHYMYIQSTCYSISVFSFLMIFEPLGVNFFILLKIKYSSEVKVKI